MDYKVHLGYQVFPHMEITRVALRLPKVAWIDLGCTKRRPSNTLRLHLAARGLHLGLGCTLLQRIFFYVNNGNLHSPAIRWKFECLSPESHMYYKIPEQG